MFTDPQTKGKRRRLHNEGHAREGQASISGLERNELAVESWVASTITYMMVGQWA